MDLSSIKSVLERYSIKLSQSAYNEIKIMLRAKIKRTHMAFLLDQSNHVIVYRPNIYFKTKSFPFSQHAEINAIINYYSKQLSKKITNGSKRLLVIRFGGTCLRMSRPCRNCAAFIANNWDNLHLKEVLYSDNYENLVSLTREDLLQSSNFCLSAASRISAS